MTITTEQVRALRLEAAEAGDWEGVDACHVALNTKGRFTAEQQAQALAECERMIAAARAMED